MLAWDVRHGEHRNGPVWNVALLCLVWSILCERTNHSFEGAQCEATILHVLFCFWLPWPAKFCTYFPLISYFGLIFSAIFTSYFLFPCLLSWSISCILLILVWSCLPLNTRSLLHFSVRVRLGSVSETMNASFLSMNVRKNVESFIQVE